MKKPQDDIQEVSLERVMRRTNEVIERITDDTMSKVSSVTRTTRERAIQKITLGLDETNIEDQFVITTLPLEFLRRGDILSALWYIETIGKQNRAISPEVYNSVMTSALKSLDILDEGFHDVLIKSIESVSRMALKNQSLNQLPITYTLLAQYTLFKDDIISALNCFTKAGNLGDSEQYIEAALLYDTIDAEVTGLEFLWEICQTVKDPFIFSHIIYELCQNHMHEEAIRMYREFQFYFPDTVAPFLVYKGSIENDEELKDVEEILATYHEIGDYIPSPALLRLVRSTQDYVDCAIIQENTVLSALYQKEREDWTDADHRDFSLRSIRRLWLIQLSVLVLRNEQLIRPYANMLDQLGIKGAQNAQILLGVFFEEHESRELKHIIATVNTMENEADNPDDTPEIPRIQQENTTMEHLGLHIAHMEDIFYEPHLYDTIKHFLNPLQEKVWERGKVQNKDILIKKRIQDLSRLKSSLDFLNSFDDTVRNLYSQLIEHIDEKYGVFYRRSIQSLAIKTPNTESFQRYIPVFQEHEDVSLLFWIEKILHDLVSFPDVGALSKFLKDYGLEYLDGDAAFLFGNFIFQENPEVAISYLAGVEGMIERIDVLLLISQGLCLLDEEKRQIIMPILHNFIREKYNEPDWFTYVKNSLKELNTHENSPEIQNLSLLTKAHTTLVENEDENQAMQLFSEADATGVDTRGLEGMAEMLFRRNKYDEVFALFDRIIERRPSIEVFVTVVGYAIQSGNFAHARLYIDRAIQFHEYNMDSSVLALAVWEGRTEDAIKQYISMIQRYVVFSDTPSGTFIFFQKYLKEILESPDSRDGTTDIMKIHASFVLYHISCISSFGDTELLHTHSQLIWSLPDSYEGELLHSIISQSISLFLPEGEQVPCSTASVELLNNHLYKIHASYIALLKQIEPTERTNVLKYAKELAAMAIKTLQMFPETEAEVHIWRARLVEIDDYDVSITPSTEREISITLH